MRADNDDMRAMPRTLGELNSALGNAHLADVAKDVLCAMINRGDNIVSFNCKTGEFDVNKSKMEAAFKTAEVFVDIESKYTR